MASSSSTPTVKPIRKRRLNSPNEHILELVKDWYTDARANGAQTVHSYKKVLPNSIDTEHRVQERCFASVLGLAILGEISSPLRNGRRLSHIVRIRRQDLSVDWSKVECEHSTGSTGSDDMAKDCIDVWPWQHAATDCNCNHSSQRAGGGGDRSSSQQASKTSPCSKNHFESDYENEQCWTEALQQSVQFFGGNNDHLNTSGHYRLSGEQQQHPSTTGANIETRFISYNPVHWQRGSLSILTESIARTLEEELGRVWRTKIEYRWLSLDSSS